MDDICELAMKFICLAQVILFQKRGFIFVKILGLVLTRDATSGVSRIYSVRSTDCV